MRPLAALAATALLITGCRRADSNDTETPAPTSPGPARDASETMHEYFDAVDAIRAALVDGDLAAAQNEATRVVEAPLAADLAHWKEHVDRMREIGRELQASRDVEQASITAARLGAACGDCHRALGFRPELKRAPEPAADPEVDAQMQRHAWAVDQMWEGLVVPSDDRWKIGAAAIAEAPLVGDGSTGDVLAALEKRAAEVHALGRRAVEAPPQERAALLGALLGGCGGCHRLANPRATPNNGPGGGRRSRTTPSRRQSGTGTPP
jgi:cytochrome c553